MLLMMFAFVAQDCSIALIMTHALATSSLGSLLKSALKTGPTLLWMNTYQFCSKRLSSNSFPLFLFCDQCVQKAFKVYKLFSFAKLWTGCNACTPFRLSALCFFRFQRGHGNRSTALIAVSLWTPLSSSFRPAWQRTA